MYFVNNNKSGFIHSCMFSTGRTKKIFKKLGALPIKLSIFSAPKGGYTNLPLF